MINVGEYIRTKQGYIAKVISQDVYIELDKPVDFKQTSGTHYAGQILFDEGDIEITKHSKNIIDLIEVGDFIKLRFFADTYDDDSEEVETYCKLENRHTVNQIKENIKANYCEILSILTHEMYKQNCYKVGED